jgi:hypothetical protein
MSRFRFPMLLSVILVLVASASAFAGSTFTVTTLADSGAGSLRAAITSANGSSGSTINFQSGLNGTITLQSVLPIITDPTTITGPTATTIAIDGNDNNFNIFQFGSSASASGSISISNLTLQNGKIGFDNVGTSANATLTNVGISNDSVEGVFNAGTITVTNSTISGCTSTGFLNSGGDCSATLTDTTIESSGASGDAGISGGFVNDGAATFTSCTISENNTGVYNNEGTLSMSYSTIDFNSAYETGGGVFSNLGSATLTSCYISSNNAGGSGYGNGGGVFADGGLTMTGCTVEQNSVGPGGVGAGIDCDSDATSTITGCSIFGNTSAGTGGGITNLGTAALTSCTIYDNSASVSGAGIENSNAGYATIVNCTFDDNSAQTEGGAIYNTGAGSALSLANDILYADTAPSGPEIFNDGDYVDASYSDIDGGYGGTKNFNTTPLLASFGYYGGASPIFPLLPGSPCLNTGSSQGLTEDQRGFPIPPGGPYDVGSFQSSGFTVSASDGNNQQATTGTEFTLDLTATVTPISSLEPVVDGNVTFSAPTSGASATLSSTVASISTNGTAAVIATANGTTGTYNVKADTFAGSGEFSLTNLSDVPTITSFAPTSGPVGTMIDVLGTNFSNATAASVDGYPATFVVNSNDSITVTVPSGAKTGAIHVKNPAGLGASATNFTVIGVPVITSFNPVAAPVGASVTVTGSSFTGVTAASIDGYPATFTFNSDSSVTIVIPHGAGDGPIHIKNAEGLGSSTTNFLVVGVPVVSSFNPSAGPVGTSVTVTGSSFTGITAASVDGYPATFTFNSDSSVTILIPHGAGTGPIHIKNAEGLGSSTTNFIVVGVPVVSSFNPTAGPVGTSVNVTGSSFTGITAASVDGYPATFTFNNDGSVTIVIPHGAGTGPIHIKNPEGLGSSTTNFTVTP